jgi:hypothetical protein
VIGITGYPGTLLGVWQDVYLNYLVSHEPPEITLTLTHCTGCKSVVGNAAIPAHSLIVPTPSYRVGLLCFSP